MIQSYRTAKTLSKGLKTNNYCLVIISDLHFSGTSTLVGGVVLIHLRGGPDTRVSPPGYVLASKQKYYFKRQIKALKRGRRPNIYSPFCRAGSKATLFAPKGRPQTGPSQNLGEGLVPRATPLTTPQRIGPRRCIT